MSQKKKSLSYDMTVLVDYCDLFLITELVIMLDVVDGFSAEKVSTCDVGDINNHPPILRWWSL
jgi:hypothetical protein